MTAIDGLGGVKSSMDDDTKANHEKTGCGKLYFLFALINLAAIGFIQFYIPETKGKSPEEISNWTYGSDYSTTNDDGTLSGAPASAAAASMTKKWSIKDEALNAPLIASGYSLTGSTVSHSL